ncbi:MAG: phage virion morphogenesis protein [Alistipes sp.]|nr:phage virion morphogenesis protein [Alistipes sp.]
MKPEELSRFFEQKRKEFEDYRRNKWPRMAGEIAQAHFQDNFRRGGHLTGGKVHKWPKTKRQASVSKKAESNYGPLLSERKALMKSIRYVPQDARVRVFTDLPYAAIHNFGGTINIHPTVTPKMRRFAWAMYHKTKGEDKNDFNVWKALALTKKEKLDITVKIPQRLFLNDAPEVREAIEKATIEQIAKLFNNI